MGRDDALASLERSVDYSGDEVGKAFPYPGAGFKKERIFSLEGLCGGNRHGGLLGPVIQPELRLHPTAGAKYRIHQGSEFPAWRLLLK